MVEVVLYDMSTQSLCLTATVTANANGGWSLRCSILFSPSDAYLLTVTDLSAGGVNAWIYDNPLGINDSTAWILTPAPDQWPSSGPSNVNQNNNQMSGGINLPATVQALQPLLSIVPPPDAPQPATILVSTLPSSLAPLAANVDSTPTMSD
jgi:hypothetical protein